MPPEPIAPSDHARRTRRRDVIAGPVATLVATALLALVAGPALTGPGTRPDDVEGCPPPPYVCVVHLGAVQVAPPETPTTATPPSVAGRTRAERGPVGADRPCAVAHRPRGPPSRDDA